MKLTKFEVKNFKGLENVSINLGSFGTIIGENNVGKSTVLQALELFLSGKQANDVSLFLNKSTDREHAIELVGYFADLSESEKEAVAVRGRMNGNEWIIKKIFWCEREDGGKDTWKELYQSFSSLESIQGWPESDRSWNNFPAEFNNLTTQVKTEFNQPRTPTNPAKDRLKQLIREQMPDRITTTPPAWVDNPGGAGNWKSNAVSIMPLAVTVRAVHDATAESASKDASTYGQLVNLIVERKMMLRAEVKELQRNFEKVLKLFQPGEEQAPEVKELQARINARLNEVIGGIVEIETDIPDIKPIILPSTTLTMRENEGAVQTKVKDQGHGLQRTLIMSLIQIFAEEQSRIESAVEDSEEVQVRFRPVYLLVEEPELYMHPQMERKMRDTLIGLSRQENIQVMCTTHSPVFIDLEADHTGLIRMYRNQTGSIEAFQPQTNLFDGITEQEHKERLNLLNRFDPAVNEVFFAKRVVLLEEKSALWAFERAAELNGLFARHPSVRRDVCIIVTDSKYGIAPFLKVMNHFKIPYIAMPDSDTGNTDAQTENQKIEELATQNAVHYVNPNLEGLLGYVATKRDKPFQAVKKVEELHRSNSLPEAFIKTLNMVYFGQEAEPQPRVQTTAGQVDNPIPAP